MNFKELLKYITESTIRYCPLCGYVTTHVEVNGKETCTKCNKNKDKEE